MIPVLSYSLPGPSRRAASPDHPAFPVLTLFIRMINTAVTIEPTARAARNATAFVIALGINNRKMPPWGAIIPAFSAMDTIAPTAPPAIQAGRITLGFSVAKGIAPSVI